MHSKECAEIQELANQMITPDIKQSITEVDEKSQLSTCLSSFLKNLKLPFLLSFYKKGSILYKNRAMRAFLLHLRKKKWLQLSS